MKPLLLLCALLAAPQDPPLPPAPPLDPETAAAAWVQVVTARDVYYRHEPFAVTLRIGYDPDYFRRRGVRLFRQELDLQVQVEAPWLVDLPGTTVLPAPEPAPGRARTLVVGGAVARARPAGEERQGKRVYRVLEIVRRFRPERLGPLTLPPVRLRFDYGTRFTEDLVKGRVAVDRKQARIQTGPVRLRVDPLPEAGRPEGFGGGVGHFDLTASLDREGARVGESVRLVLRLVGTGNLDRLTPPKPGELDGLLPVGRIDEVEVGERLISYDLVPTRPGRLVVPPIPFSWYQPGRGYRTLRTPALALNVRPLPAGTVLRHLPGEGERQARPGINDLHGLKTRGGRGRAAGELPGWLLGLGLLGPGVLAAALAAGVRWRTRWHAGAAGRRARGAAAVLRAGLDAPGANPAALLRAYLAARLMCAEAAVVGPDLPRRLVAAGVGAPLAERTGSVVTRLAAVHFGGGPGEGAAAALPGLVAELEAAFDAAGKGAP